MALILCPECGKQISETTPSCPHCGYQLAAQAAPSGPAPTPIGNIKTNPISGALIMIMGGLGILVSFLFGPFFFIPLIGAVLMLGAGWGQLTGMQPVECPYCGKLAQMSCKAENYKCGICKKRSVRKGGYLYPVD